MPRRSLSDGASAKKVRAHRAKLRAQGLRQVQLWVRDVRAPGFAEDARRQSLAAAEADRRDEGLFELMEAAWVDLERK